MGSEWYIVCACMKISLSCCTWWLMACIDFLMELPSSGEQYFYDTPRGMVVTPLSTFKDLGITSNPFIWFHLETTYLQITKLGSTITSWILGTFKDISPEMIYCLVWTILECYYVLWSPQTKGEKAHLMHIQWTIAWRISGCKGMIYWHSWKHLKLWTRFRKF